MSRVDPVAFPADLADPDPVAAPAVPDGPLFPRVAPADPVGLVAPLGVLVVPAARVVLAVPEVLAARVAPADPVAVGLVAPAARAAPRDLTTAARPLPRPRCGWPRRHGAARPA
ncbi:hypothetical protein [Amycolatopsis balhimycina]|uniref:hypothetical protein n=1 Tax=Amycolatopsis balhimycina TaxID=208443 RepID=UPI00036FC04B|nr:hypothetical protein [Amycolatopsis balhimycina]